MATERPKKRIKPMGLNFAASERPFVEAMKLADDGDVLIEASDKLKSVVRAVRENGGKGQLTIKIEVAGQGKAVAMRVSCTKKEPEAKRPATKVFADDHGHLGLHDPDQYEMEDVLDEAASKPPVPAEM